MHLPLTLRQSFLAIALTAPVACSSLPEPPPELPFEVPERWQQGSVIPFNWAEQLQSSQLDALIQKALEHNADLEATALRWQASLQQVKSAAGQSWPELNANVNGRRQNQGAGAANSYTAELSASWVLDVWGQLADSEASAFYSARQQAQLYRWARISLASEVAQLWLEAIEAKLQWQLALAREQNLKLTYEVIYGGFETGVNAALDVYSAKASWQNGQTNTLQNLQQYRRILRQLAVLVGDYPNLEQEIPNLLPEQLKTLPENLSSNLLAQRPDLQALSDKMAAQEKSLGVARKNRLPRLSLTANYGGQSSELDQLFSGDQMVWSLLGGITAPLFKGGQLKAEQERQAVLYQATIADYRQGALNAFLEVENYLEGEAFLAEQYQSTKQASASAELALQQATESYSAGLVGGTSLLQSERTAFDRQSQLLSLKQQRLQNRIRLYLALGTDLTGNSSLTELASNQEADQ